MTALSSPTRARVWLPRLRALLTFQRSKHTADGLGNHGELCTVMGSSSLIVADHVELHNWKRLDSRSFGVTRSMISKASLDVVKILQNEGYEAYLVGGCVRDLILKRIPKDFDVITTAALPKIRKKFHRCIIIGRRFPICRVKIGGSFVEVSSFDTLVDKRPNKKNKIQSAHMPAGCDERDILRWRNCMDRDFTINSLFYDPFVNKIYDYSNALEDLKSLKLRTLLPAHISFKEDCARILRGLRLAARLNLSFAKETETAIQKLSSSILSLNTSRLLMEVNYMLSYGAAEGSLCLLKRYDLLELLLPFHNAYLTEQSYLESAHHSMMLMKLFSNLDLLVTCDRPSDCTLWLAILAFHMALIKDPQHALVVLSFASLLYHGKWEEGISYARGHIDAALRYDTEILDSDYCLSDDELTERVTEFTTLVKNSIDVLTDSNSLKNSMVNFPGHTCSGLVFISQRMGRRVEQVFDTLVKEGLPITSLNIKRVNYEIDYNSLGKGDTCETSFVLGRIILDTMIHAGNSDSKEKDFRDEINPRSNSDSKEKDFRDEINPRSELEWSGKKCHEHLDPKKSIGDQSRSLIFTLHDILKDQISQSPQDEFQAILGDVIHESRNDDESEKVELNHDKKFQLSAGKHSKKLDGCHDLLVREQGPSMREHQLLEEECIEENGIAVGRDEPNQDHKRPTSKRNAEHAPPKVEIKRVLAMLGRIKKEKVIHDKRSELPARKQSKRLRQSYDLLVRKQVASMHEHHFPEEESVEESKIVVDRDTPNLDLRGLTSEQNAEHNLKNVESKIVKKNVESKKVPSRLGVTKEKEDLIHHNRFQLPAKKHSNILVRKQVTSKQEHHFPEKGSVEENKIVVNRDEQDVDHLGLTSKLNAEANPKNVESKRSLTRLFGLFK